jgi:phosphoenolpyruvate synthase/pyruvate phosphate dikinase
MERREFAGAVVAQTLSANMLITSTTFSVTDGSTFPTGDLNNFVVSIGRGNPYEEKILISSRSGNTFTVSARGYDGTTAIEHTVGELVDHVLDATAVQSMNTTVYDNQILNWMGV